MCDPLALSRRTRFVYKSETALEMCSLGIGVNVKVEGHDHHHLTGIYVRATININWESHRPCVVEPSLSQYFRAFEEVLKVHKVKHVEQKAFDDGRGKPPWLSCLC